MTLLQLQALIDSGDITKAINVFEISNIIKNIGDAIKQYDPKKHDITDTSKRQDKTIKSEEGNTESVVKVARLPLPIQKKIVLVAAAFLGNPTIESTPEGTVQEDLVKILKKVWTSNKLDYKFKNIAKKTMSERQCAELWYTQEVDPTYWEGFPFSTKFKLSMKILSYSLGDDLYPVFDEFGDMIAFGRGYKIKDQDGKEQQYFDLYTADKFYFAKSVNNVWLFSNGKDYSTGVKPIANPILKIPIVYYSQPLTEWDDVQELIDRLEKKISNHADTNDYFDSPIVVASGTVTGFANKGESGKLLEAKEGADVKYLTWDQAPESTRMEIENLQRFIYAFTHTPDISFENMKGLGVFSGIALKMLFMDAHLKASDKEEIFGEGLQRRINYLTGAIAVLDSKFKAALVMEIKPKFTYFLPENILEQVDILVKAVSGRILSAETAVSLNPLVNDHDVEMDRLTTEQPETGGGSAGSS
jgi:SPP1 family phage portal protein